MSDKALLLSILGRTYALALDDVETVMQAEPLIPLPGLPPPVLGVVQARGRVIVVADAGLLLHPETLAQPQSVPHPGEMFVVLARRGDGLAIANAVPVGVASGRSSLPAAGGGASDPLPLDAAALMAGLDPPGDTASS